MSKVTVMAMLIIPAVWLWTEWRREPSGARLFAGWLWGAMVLTVFALISLVA